MCWQALPLILSAVGTGAQVVGQNRALRQQDEETARGIARMAERQREAGTKVQENIRSLQTSTPEAERTAANADYVAALRKAETVPGREPLPAVAGASERFAEDVGAARATVGGESAQLAGRLARVDAPIQQRLREGRTAADTASQLSLIESRAAGEDFLNRLRVAMIRPNSGLMAGGQLLAGFGSGFAGRAQPDAASGGVFDDKMAPGVLSPYSYRRRAPRITETPGGTTTHFGGP